MDPAAIIQRDDELEGMHLLTQIELRKSNTTENVILESPPLLQVTSMYI